MSAAAPITTQVPFIPFVQAKPVLRIESVDPERAYALLERNPNNRRLRERIVSQYARDMRDGNWLPGAGEPIHVAPSGEIGNGQHRLYAVIEADVTVELPFLYAPLAYRRVADQGAKRKFGDVLKIEYGEGRYAMLAAATRVLYEYETTREIESVAIAPSTAELIDVYQRSIDRGLRDSLIHGDRAGRGVGVVPALGIAFHLLFSTVDERDATQFFDHLADGVGLEDGSPILALRKFLFNPERRRDRRLQAALLIKSFNAYRAGKHIKQARWLPAEGFPAIKGLRQDGPLF